MFDNIKKEMMIVQLTPTKETVKSGKAGKTGKPDKTASLIRGWATNNIFHFRMWDGILYALLYIAAPIFITWISLNALQNDLLAAVYCYFTITISAMSCFHDALGRFDGKKKSVRNVKLRLILLASFIAAIYGFFQFLAIVITRTLDFRNDAILCLYLLGAAIAAIDVIALFGREDCIVSVIEG